MMTSVDCTFNLVINKGDLECFMRFSDQIEMRMNTYRDKVGRFLRLGDHEDEDGNRDNNEGGEEKGGTKMTAKKTKRKKNNREESCGVVELVQAMLVLTCMYKLILCMVRDVRTITT